MTGYHCEGCGRKSDPAELQEVVRRSSGCKLWLCSPCCRTTLSLGVETAEEKPEEVK